MRTANVDGEVGIGHFHVNYSISVAPNAAYKTMKVLIEAIFPLGL